jgi:hypothetical protein
MNQAIENAIRFIGTELKENPAQDIARLIQEACQKYDLNPMQTEFLTNKYILNK